MTKRIQSMSAISGTATRLDATGPPEVRTPLTSLNGALKLVNSGSTGQLPEKAAQMSRLAQRNGERLQLLISDLLDFNKIRSDDIPEHFKPRLFQRFAQADLSISRTT